MYEELKTAHDFESWKSSFYVYPKKLNCRKNSIYNIPYKRTETYLLNGC